MGHTLPRTCTAPTQNQQRVNPNLRGSSDDQSANSQSSPRQSRTAHLREPPNSMLHVIDARPRDPAHTLHPQTKQSRDDDTPDFVKPFYTTMANEFENVDVSHAPPAATGGSSAAGQDYGGEADGGGSLWSSQIMYHNVGLALPCLSSRGLDLRAGPVHLGPSLFSRVVSTLVALRLAYLSCWVAVPWPVFALTLSLSHTHTTNSSLRILSVYLPFPCPVRSRLCGHPRLW